MRPFFIAATDTDVIIGVIAVVAWILSQIFSKKKGEPSQQEGPSPEAGPTIDPRDELRKFFDELEKAAKPQPPPQPAAPPPIHIKKHREKPARPLPEPRKETLSSQTRPIFSAVESAPVFQEKIFVSTPAHTPVLPELRNPIALRKFIIATEILGKPVALRQG